MKQIPIISKTFGKHFLILDDSDFEKVKQLGGKWCVVLKRGRFYAQKRINKKIIEMQRFLTDAKAGQYVDHINGNPLDNRRYNLRICSNGANLRNGRVRPNNTSGITGVHLNKRGKWEAYIKVNYRKIHLGLYTSKKEAKTARQLAEVKYFDQ